ncbi:phosphate transporter [Desulfurococcus mucosus DSM 2162]|uniref:Phosphate transporter n=1 Tax=Desulfurococcus mucosus (strain ATCC 35584 / DSM 2162 / JCM 9187 / O7/1) TaxID=765177 RepID=E8R821_DESM0|nr:phosphate transporter [Desulfurococcus mucosus DSM 2162]
MVLAGFIGAFMLAWIDGANNAANSIGTVIGARALPVRRALLIASFFELAGGVVYGEYISSTLASRVVDTSNLPPRVAAVGFASALIVSFIIVFAATRRRIPFSISIVMVGAVAGVGLAAGVEHVNTVLISELFALWILIPLISILAGYTYYRLYSYLRSRRSLYAKTFLPLLLLYASFTVSAVYMAIPGHLLSDPLILGTITLLLAAPLASLLLYLYRVLHREVLEESEVDAVVGRFNRRMLIASSAILAFTHGGHDVANAAAPLMVILESTGVNHTGSQLLILAYSSLGISTGVLSWGASVARTIGEEITVLNPESALVANIAGAQTTLVVTRLGLPSSMVGIVVGSIIGVGLARGVSGINTRLFARMLSYWYAGFTVAALATYTATRILAPV